MTTQRGRHRKLRRNILHTIIATALLAGTFTAVDQGINASPANAAAPVVISATTAGTSNSRSILITLSEATAALTAPMTSYKVNIDGLDVNPTGASRGSTKTNEITLTLPTASRVTNEQIVKVTYNAPATDNTTANNAIQDVAGVDAVSFTNVEVVNASTLVRPKFTSVSIGPNGRTLTMQVTPDTYVSGVKFFVNGEEQPLADPSLSGTTGTISSSDTVTMDYLPGVAYISTTDIKRETGWVVTNNSTVPADTVVPILQSATLAGNGTTLTLKYNETLSWIHPATYSALSNLFSIKANGVQYPIKSLSSSFGADFVLLELAGYIDSTQTVTLDYSSASTGATTSTGAASRTNLALQDPSGNDTSTLSGQSVTNQSTQPVDQLAPSISTIARGSTNTVVLTYNEPLWSSISPADAFTLFINGGSAVKPSSISQSAVNGITLTVTDPIPTNAKIDVLYVSPARDDSVTTNLAIQDYVGNDARSKLTLGYKPWSWDNQGTVNCTDAQGLQNAFLNSSRKRTLPNGVTYSVGVSGPNICINSIDEALSGRSGVDAQFASIGTTSDPGVFLNHLNPVSPECGAKVAATTQYCVRPDSFVTINFDQAVTNPVISFAGWGSGAASKSWSEMRLVTPNLTLTHLPGTVSTNILLEQNGTYLRPGTVTPSTQCTNTNGSGAGCGSFRINGTITEAKFSLVFAANGPDWGARDDWNITASVTEDFGFAPESYDEFNAASHVFGTLRLGSNVTPDNLNYLYGTINGDAVSSGSSIPSGEDGVSSWPGFGAAGSQYVVPVSFAGASKPVNVCGWIDFNVNGIFDSGERSCQENIAANATSTSLTWTVPAGLAEVSTYSRIRLSYDPIVTPYGKLSTGEVEDYQLSLMSKTTANPDASSGGQGLPQTVNLLTNVSGQDSAAAGTTLDESSVKLCAVANPSATPPVAAETAPNCTKTSVVVPGVGTYSVSNTGVMTFTPLSTFTGTPTPLSYTVTDSNGGKADSTYAPTVYGAPTATPDTSSGPQGVAQSRNVLSNVVGTSDSAGSGASLVPSSLVLSCPETPTTPTCSVSDGVVTIAGQGTYTKATDGTVTFTPVSNFSGTPTPVKYTVSDNVGQSVSSTYTPTIYPKPTADDETSTGAFNTPQAPIDVLLGDTPGNSSAPLDPDTLRLCDPSTTPPQTGATCDKTIVTTADGTYEIVNGKVVFTPANNFHGVATPIDYIVEDSLGQIAQGTITPTVNKPTPPTADPETKSVLPGQSVSFTTITGANGLASGTQLQTTGANKTCLFTPNTTICDADNSITIVGEGTYTLDPTTGVVTFAADANATSAPKTPITYRVTDVTGQSATDTLTPIIPPPPAADDETSTGAFNTPQAPIDVLLGDTPGNSAAPLDPSTLKLCDPSTTPPQTGATCDKTIVTTADGTYEIVNGKVVFTPANNFHGVATPIDYIVKDSLGQIAQGTIAPTVNKPTPPIADPETKSVLPGQSVSFTTITGVNGLASGTQLQTTGANKTCLFTPNTTICDADNSITIVGEGTYTLDPATGIVTFAADANATSAPKTPITYRVTDVTGQSATDTLTPIIPPPPVADDETSTGAFNTPQAPIDVLLGDTPGNSSAPLDPDTLRLCDPSTTPPQTGATCDKTIVTTADGTYEIVNGKVVFTPANNFHGPATPIDYIVKDSLGQIAQGTITPTVNKPTPPTADPETKSVLPGQSVSFTTITGANGLASGTQLQTTGANKTCLFTPNTTICDADNSITIVGEGTYTLDPTTGVVTFAADANATSAPKTPITYRVTDVTGQSATDTLTPVIPPPPAADDETDTVPFNTAKQIDVLNGDTPGDPSAPLVPATLKLCGANETAPNCTKDEVIVPEGTYRIVNGKVEFTPNTNFSGPVTPIDYIVEDSLGQVAQGTITLNVPIPPAPTAKPDVTSGPWNTPQSINVVDNASGNTGDDVAGTGATLIPSSVVLSCGAAADCTTATVNGKIEVTIANQGTYSLGSNGEVIFTPLSTFKNTATPVTYTVSDNAGQTATTTYTPTVAAPPAPMADPETTSGIKGATQTIDLIPGDTTFDPAITLVRASVALSCKSGVANCSVTNNKVTIVGVGTYEIDPANPGHMLFTPEPNFTGVGPAVNYTVTDSMGGTASSTYTPTVIPPPTVVSDTTSAGWNVTQRIDVVTSTAGADTTNTKTNSQDTVSPLTSWKPNSITIDCANEANCTETVVNGVVTEVIMTGQGTYSVDPATNVITFVPVDTFTGIARPVTYSISDARDQVSSTTYTPTVIAPPVPTASPDTVELLPGQSKVFSSIFDGQTGDTDPALATKGAGAPDLTNSTVCIIDPATNVCDSDGIVTIAGQGTYTLNPTTGIVTYAALSSATPGAKTPVTYKITDGLGRSVTNTLTPTITPPPVANPDFSTGVQGAIQTLSPVGNDRPGGGASTELFPDTRAQIPSGIFLCAANEPPPDCAASTVTVTDPVTGVTLGVLTVAASGLVTFTPEPNFIGTTPPIGYQLPDNLGQKAYSTITITVLPPPAPSATTDTGSAQYNNPVTLKPWTNDAAGAVPAGSSAPAPKLIATSIRLCDDNSTFVAMSGAPADCTAMKVKTIEGTYEVNATTGEVVFTPVDGFIGTVKYPPTYQIWTDWSGPGGAKSATALLVPTIAPPGAPAAEVDVTKTKPGTSVVLNPVGNDIPGFAALDPTSIRLCGSDETAPECTLMKATTIDGTYVVNPTTGEVTFTPRAGFTGEATIPYIIKDAMGMIAASHLIITVEDIEIVPVVAKTPVVLAKTGGARPDLLLLLGLVALAGAGGLRFASRKTK